MIVTIRPAWALFAVFAAVIAGCGGGEETGDNQQTTSDTTSPTVVITGPSSGSAYSTDQSSIDLAGTASDNVGVERVTWTSDRGGQGTATGTNDWSVSSIALEAGDNSITVTAADAAGNTSTDVITVTYTPNDVTPPTVTITSPTSVPTYATGTGTVDLGGTANDNVGVTSVTWVNDQGGSGTAIGADNWSVTGIALSIGDNQITVTAADAAGNSSTDALTVTYDPGSSAPPTITITSPTSAPTFTTQSSTITISGTAADDVGVDRVTWSANGGAAEDAVGQENWSTPVIMLNAGLNTITVTAYDADGNTAVDQIDVTFDAVGSDVLRGIGIIGDSNSDEYRADDNRGGAYAATTFNWVEQLVRYRGLNFGAWGTRASPRRTGYAFNWALSGATAASALSRGQHTGVAGQVAAGDVTLVVISIGWNDFARDKYTEIYSGALSGAALDAKIDGVIADITTAVDTVLAAGPLGVVVADLFDYSIAQPALLFAYPDPNGRQAVTDAIRRVNAGLAAMAQPRGVVVVDSTAYSAALYGRADANGFIDVGGELIDTVTPSNEPHHLTLADTHAGTVGSSFAANGLFIEPVNAAFGTSLVPFSEEEMLSIAGITP